MAAVWKTTAGVYDSRLRDYVTVTVALEINWQKVADEMAPKAYANKSKRSKLVGGAIVAEIVSK